MDSMENFSYVPSLTLHGLSMDTGGSHYRDALRLGLPFHLDTTYLETVHGQRIPYRQISYFPFHGPLGVCEYSFEPAFIRKRNERERHRVRCVNEGYARLREHLPQEFQDKRLSKVETLRAAIDYINHLQSLLDVNASGVEVTLGAVRQCAQQPQRTECSSD
ncbi:achaete-scute homolog 4-like [Notolabrus celidotus]|uniref:achaete-scute homolog 4-like n=1 Tax=Notolabrus celidotus TaxID=1203425 RepID=UPI00148F50C0|nr:achaete-scute homolog 4-like [Notolabrus celidotus]